MVMNPCTDLSARWISHTTPSVLSEAQRISRKNAKNTTIYPHFTTPNRCQDGYAAANGAQKSTELKSADNYPAIGLGGLGGGFGGLVVAQHRFPRSTYVN